MTAGSVPTSRRASAQTQGWVLVLVREQRLRQLLMAVLGRAGYVLLGCATLADAQQTLAHCTTPRLILFDGAEASEATLRDQVEEIESCLSPGASCRLIAFSLAHPQPRLGQLRGVDALIARPFDLTLVLDKVEALMRIP